MPPPAPAGGDHLKALDGLRGIAALVVMLGHSAYVYVDSGRAHGWLEAGLKMVLRGGHPSVILFFSLSGFVPQWSALCIFTKAAAGGSPIEFVIPDGGPLERFNKGAGGLHHIALQVPSLDALAKALDGEGMRLLEPTHVKGAGPFLCNFLSPVYTRGITIEFVELL